MDAYDISQDDLQRMGDKLVGRIVLVGRPTVILASGTPLEDLFGTARITRVHRDANGRIESVDLSWLDPEFGKSDTVDVFAIFAIVRDQY